MLANCYRALRALRRGKTMCLATLGLLGATGLAHAENGRDFSGVYDMGSATKLDATHVSVKLYLRLNNHSGADLKNAQIALADPLERSKASSMYASGVTANRRGVVKVTGTVTVDSREYLRWRGGPGPSLVVRVPDKHGQMIDHPIELQRLRGVEKMR